MVSLSKALNVQSVHDKRGSIFTLIFCQNKILDKILRGDFGDEMKVLWSLFLFF